MDKYFGEWVPYSGNSAILLGAILLVIAGVFAILGFRLKESLRVKTPGKAIMGMLVAVWILSILTFLIDISVYAILFEQTGVVGITPPNPITKFTFSFAFISFLILLILNRKQGMKVAFFGAAFAAMAGPMIFELPFDLIVIGRTYPPVPPNPTTLRLLFFLPLFSIELTTISLMFFSPLFKVTQSTLYSLAGMFLVFAVWGFLSFSFAYTTEFLILNVIAKAMAFLVVITLFLPQKTAVSAELLVEPSGKINLDKK